MKRTLTLLFLAFTAVLDAAAPPQANPPRNPDDVPKGLAKSDWQSIRAAYEAGRHAFQPVEGGWQARNPGQQWTTKFDGRGFLAKPKDGDWSWGLELQSYGLGEKQTPVGASAPQVKAEGQRLSYDWDATVQEWWVNDQRGLEHGYIVRERPAGNDQADLTFTLSTRGTLTPKITADARGVAFADDSGVTVLNYSGLKVWDADGKVLVSRFEAAGAKTVRLLVEEQGARYPLTIDPIAQQAYFKPAAFGTTQVGDNFGVSVSVSGDTVVVGADQEGSSTTGVGSTPDELAPGSGAAYVFVRSAGVWTQQAYLKASNTEAGDQFGYSVSASGDTVVVGAYGEDSSTTGDGPTNNSANGAGAAYVFVRSGATWTQEAYLKSAALASTKPGDAFGYSVAISGDTVVVGANAEDSSTTGVNGPATANNSAVDSGAAYVFVRSAGVWTQQASLKPATVGTSQAGDRFGTSVAIEGDTVAVGAEREDSSTTGVNSTANDTLGTNGDAGAAYVFARSGTTWTQQAYLKASNTGATDFFGISVAVTGDTVVVGASQEDSGTTGVNSTPNESAPDAGAAYVFVRSGAAWSQQAYLKPADVGTTQAGDRFGVSVAVTGDTVVVGASQEDSGTTGVNSTPDESASDAGAAYVFVRSGATWSQQAYLKPAAVGTTQAGDRFGVSVAGSVGTVMVGASGEDSNTTGVNSTPDDALGEHGNSGAAYAFTGLGVSDTGNPEIALSGISTNIADGDTIPSTTDGTDFGRESATGGTVVRTFTITNNDTGALTLPGTPRVVVSGTHAADFTVTAQPAVSVLGAGESTTFEVTFNLLTSGLRTAALSIANNDTDENPFNFAIQGTGGDPEIRVTGNGTSISDGDSFPATGDLTDFGTVPAGGGAVVRTFTIASVGGANVTLWGTPRVVVSGATSSAFTVTAQPAVSVLAPGSSTTFEVTYDPNFGGLSTAALSIANNDADENPFNFTIQGMSPNPEIGVVGNGSAILDGDITPATADHTDFGSTVVRTFTITSSGGADLILDGTPKVAVSGTHAADFTVTAQPGVSALAAGSNTTFQVTFNSNTSGVRRATLSIASNDADENPFNFAIQGTGIIPSVAASTVNILPTATTLTIFGTVFSTIPGENVVTFSPSGTGTVTASTATSLTVTGLTGLTLGVLEAVVTNNNGSSGLPVQVAIVATPVPLSGTKTVGPTGDYTSLTTAMADIQFHGLGGALILELMADYAGEPAYPLVVPALNGASATNTLTIRPQAGVVTGLSLTSANTTAATVDLNGAQFVTFDGRPGGTGTVSRLTLENTAATGVALRFINEASSNTLTYTTLKGQNISVSSGVVFFSTTTTTGANGNDNNTLDHCDITGTDTNTPVNGLYSLGTTTTAAHNNSGNTVANCNIFNFHGTAADAAGVRLDGGNTAWTLTGNSFYQTAIRTAVAANVRAIYVNNASGNNFTVTGNFIGGDSPGAVVTTQKWTTTGTAAAYLFQGIRLNVGSTTLSSVQGNTIANMVWTTSSSANGVPGVWTGIHLEAGSANIGTVAGNTIGSGTGTGSISVTTAGSAATTNGIGSAGSGTVAIANNSIGSITTNGTGPSISAPLTGISVSAGTNTITGNTVGSTTTANSLNALNPSTHTIGQHVTGIVSSSTTSAVITGNTVANLNNNYVGATNTGQIRGIGTFAGVNTITGNTVRNLSTTSQNADTGMALFQGQSVVGIAASSTTLAGQTVSQNTVHSLANTTTANVNPTVTGIFYNGPTSGMNVIARNLVHSLANSSINAASVVNGMQLINGTFTAQNNMVRVGLNASGTSTAGVSTVRGIFDNANTAGRNFYHNSVYLGGTQPSGGSSTYAFISSSTSPVRAFQNNVFVNARSGTGKHYAVQYPGSGVNPTGLTAGGNLFHVSGSVLGFYNGADRANLAAWQAATGQDASSAVADPLFIAPTGDASAVDLHLAASNPAEGGGIPLTAAGTGATVTLADDFDGETRSSLTPADIGADAGSFTSAGDVFPPSVSYPLLSNGSTANRVLTGWASITDNVGVSSGGSAPRLYYKKSTDADAFGVANDSTGDGWKYVTATGSGPYSFTMDYSLLNGGSVSAGNTIQYFVVAQDAANNLGSSPAGSATASVTPRVENINGHGAVNSFTIVGPLSGGTVTVGAGGTYTSLSGAGGLFAALNTSVLTGNLVVNLTSDLTEDGTATLNEFVATDYPATYTVTIQPDSATMRTISGTATAGLITLNGADRVTIDGSFGGSGRYLTFRNTSNAASTILFQNDASNNTLRHCVVEGASTSSTLGVIGFSTGAVTGNDNNLITGCQVRDLTTAVAVPSNLIGSTGSTSFVANSGNTVADNELFNFNGDGISIKAAGNDSWTLTGNEIYEVIATTTGSEGIEFAASGTNLIAGNFIHDLLTTAAVSSGIFVGPSSSSSTTTVAGNRITAFNVNTATTFVRAIRPQISSGSVLNVVNNQFTLSPVNPGSTALYGIQDGSALGSVVNVFHNSIVIGGTETGTRSSWASQRHQNANIHIARNNLFLNLRTNDSSGTGNHFAAGNEVTSVNYTASHNVYAGTGATTAAHFMDFSGTANTVVPMAFATWQTSTGDTGSQAGTAGSGNFTAAMFVNAATGDLHLVPGGNALVNGTGTPIATVTTDYDGDPRSATAPTIGADESDTAGNLAPTDIALSNVTIAENNAPGATIGTLTATDPDAGDMHTFTFAGGADDGAFTITGSTLSINGSADFETKASYAIRIRATDNGAGALTYEEDFTVTITDVTLPQTITFAALGGKTFGDAAFTVSATGGASGQPVTFSISGPATIAGDLVTLTGAGDVTVTASQAGAGDYAAASDVARTFTVAKAAQAIAFTLPTSAVVSDIVTLSATGGGSGNAVTFSVVSGPGVLAGNALTFTATGPVVVRASQAGNANYFAAADVDRTITVADSTQTITFTPPSTAIITATVTLTATGGASGNPVTFSVVSGPGVLTGNDLTFTAEGPVVVRASQAGDANYAAAPDVDATITVIGVPTRWQGLLYTAGGDIGGYFSGTRVISNNTMTGSIKSGTASANVTLSFGTSQTGTTTTALGTLTVTLNTDGTLGVALDTTLSATLKSGVTATTIRQFNIALASSDVAIPGGAWARVNIIADGTFTVNGKTPDNRAVTASGRLAVDDTLEFYTTVTAASPAAIVAGSLQIADLATTDVTGEVAWNLPAQTSGLHAAGADTEFAATGSLYVANDTLALDGSGTLFVTGGGVTTTTHTVTVTDGKPAVSSTTTQPVTGWNAPTASTGAGVPKVKVPGITTAVSGSGVYLPKSKTFWGMFNGIGVAGRVELTVP